MRMELSKEEIAITQQELEWLSGQLTKAIDYLSDVSFMSEREEDIPKLVGSALGTLKCAKISGDVLLEHVFDVK